MLLSLCLCLLLAGFVLAEPRRGVCQTGEEAKDEGGISSPKAAETERGRKGLPGQDCTQIIELLQQERNLITREMAQLKRELASLREEIAKPGLKEVFAGIGYILGLTGIALYFQTRKRSPE
jgi:hypothetical protein